MSMTTKKTDDEKREMLLLNEYKTLELNERIAKECPLPNCGFLAEEEGEGCLHWNESHQDLEVFGFDWEDWENLDYEHWRDIVCTSKKGYPYQPAKEYQSPAQKEEDRTERAIILTTPDKLSMDATANALEQISLERLTKATKEKRKEIMDSKFRQEVRHDSTHKALDDIARKYLTQFCETDFNVQEHGKYTPMKKETYDRIKESLSKDSILRLPWKRGIDEFIYSSLVEPWVDYVFTEDTSANTPSGAQEVRHEEIPREEFIDSEREQVHCSELEQLSKKVMENTLLSDTDKSLAISFIKKMKEREELSKKKPKSLKIDSLGYHPQ